MTLRRDNKLVHIDPTPHTHVMATVSVSEVRSALPEILDRVLSGEEITITRNGREVAVIVHPDTIRLRRADNVFAEAERIRALIDNGRRSRLSNSPTISAERADELIAERSYR